jgi:hypothetical protein
LRGRGSDRDPVEVRGLWEEGADAVLSEDREEEGAEDGKDTEDGEGGMPI